MTLEEVVKENGFVNEGEFHRMVASVDLTAPGAIAKFKNWQHNDATKAGLEKLLSEEMR